MGIASFIEGIVGGESNIKRDMKDVFRRGGSLFDDSGALSREGIGGLRGLSNDFAERIRQGGLSKSTRGNFERQRGRASDVAARMTNSINQNLAQRRIQSGGNLSTEAAAELSTIGQEQVSQQQFDQMLGIDTAETQLEVEETRALNQWMLQIQSFIAEQGRAGQGIGLEAMLGSLGLRHRRLKAIADTIVATTGPGSGPSGGGGGGAGA